MGDETKFTIIAVYGPDGNEIKTNACDLTTMENCDPTVIRGGPGDGLDLDTLTSYIVQLHKRGWGQ